MGVTPCRRRAGSEVAPRPEFRTECGNHLGEFVTHDDADRLDVGELTEGVEERMARRGGEAVVISGIGRTRHVELPAATIYADALVQKDRYHLRASVLG